MFLLFLKTDEVNSFIDIVIDIFEKLILEYAIYLKIDKLNEKIQNIKVYKERIRSLTEAQLNLVDDLDKIEI